MARRATVLQNAQWHKTGFVQEGGWWPSNHWFCWTAGTAFIIRKEVHRLSTVRGSTDADFVWRQVVGHNIVGPGELDLFIGQNHAGFQFENRVGTNDDKLESKGAKFHDCQCFQTVWIQLCYCGVWLHFILWCRPECVWPPWCNY